jgi:hypothetical protein
MTWHHDWPANLPSMRDTAIDIAEFDRYRILRIADNAMSKVPVTITASKCNRSLGTTHDFYSEGDYWWPNPENPKQPPVRRDGISNPSNFCEHRRLLIQMSMEVAALTAAWLITRDRRYANHAIHHLVAWFIDNNTLMNPSLDYAQSIYGVVSGRGIGIVDTIHLVEVALSIEVLTSSSVLVGPELQKVQHWFTLYLRWLTTHNYGKRERNERNNHGTCWLMQVAAFSRLVGNAALIDFCRRHFRSVLVLNQMAQDGSFPLEITRTRPYSYSLFNLEMMSALCELLSGPKDDLWNFRLDDGRGPRKALEFMFPYLRDKQQWPHQHDVAFYEEWPKRHSCLLFGGIAFQIPEYVELWTSLQPDSPIFEVNRNFFIRQPILWIA